MGAYPSITAYSVGIEGTETPGSTCVFRAATHPNELVESLKDESVATNWDIFQRGLRLNGDGNFLGSRSRNDNGTLGGYTWKTYKEVERLATHVGSGLLHLGCLPILEFPDEPLKCCNELQLIGVFTKNREEWFILEEAANAYNFALVPLYDTLGIDALRFVLEQTMMTTCICSRDSLPTLIDAIGELKKETVSHMKTIVCIDDVSDGPLLNRIEDCEIHLVHWNDVISTGKSSPKPITPGTVEDVCTLCYTSGTTGMPKGVVHTHRNFVSIVCAALRGQLNDDELKLGVNDVHLSYLPLAHVLERVICSLVIASGSSIALYCGDTLKLLDDIKAAQPTFFVSVPRLFNRIHDKIFSVLPDKSSLSQYLFNTALNTKLKQLRRNGKTTHNVWDSLIFNRIKSLMGNRLRFMIVGGAPLSLHIQEKISCIFCVPFLEGYGLTETMGGSFITVARDPIKGSVGGPVPAIEFKLMSLPEIEYNVEDSVPKGELCLRGPALSVGYFRAPEMTSEAFDAEGWFHTGDVCMLLPNGAIKIIDRAKNMFKLAQGEYVSPEKIEQVYQQAFYVAQVFCFGYSEKAFLVGIVVPDEEMAKKWANNNGKGNLSFEDLCKDLTYKLVVEKDMSEVGKMFDLKGFEKIKAICLHSEAFTIENTLLTPTMKLRRHQAKNRFQETIDALYASQE